VDPGETAARLIDSLLSLILRGLRIGVLSKIVVKNDLVGPCAAHRKRISHHGPLRLSVEAQHFAKIVEEAGQNKPAGMAILPNCFGRLQQVLDLREVGVRIAFINERVQINRSLLDGAPPSRQRTVLLLFSEDEIDRLLRVVCR